jgi:integrase
VAFIVPAERYRGPRAKGKWIVGGRDAAGQARWKTVPSLEEAKELQAAWTLAERREPHRRPAVNPRITLAAYAEEWLTLQHPRLKRRTLEIYRDQLGRVIGPALGQVRVRDLSRARIRRFLAGCFAKPLAQGTVRLTYICLHALLNHAVEDELIGSNPAAKLSRQLRLMTPKETRQEQIKAMDADQLRAFLQAIEAHPRERRHFVFFLCLARAGLRLGEALALEWTALDFVQSQIHVTQGFSGRHLEATPKGRRPRSVDLSPQLAQALHRLLHERKAETLRKGWREVPRWVFCTEVGTPLWKQSVERLMTRALHRAGLPGHFTPQCLRHTFASLLLQGGEAPVYVQRQLGHASLTLTVDTYGKWLRPKPQKGGVAALDDAPLLTQSACEPPTAAVSRGPVRDSALHSVPSREWDAGPSTKPPEGHRAGSLWSGTSFRTAGRPTASVAPNPRGSSRRRSPSLRSLAGLRDRPELADVRGARPPGRERDVGPNCGRQFSEKEVRHVEREHLGPAVARRRWSSAARRCRLRAARQRPPHALAWRPVRGGLADRAEPARQTRTCGAASASGSAGSSPSPRAGFAFAGVTTPTGTA